MEQDRVNCLKSDLESNVKDGKKSNKIERKELVKKRVSVLCFVVAKREDEERKKGRKKERGA